MKFSLVTTSFNERASFEDWQHDVLGQTKSPDEIVIVDAFSSDGLAEALSTWAKQDVRVKVHQQKSNAAQGRNLAVKLSSGEVIVSTDMGCRIEPDWFEKIINPFLREPRIDVVAGAYDVQRQRLRTSAAWADFFVNNGYKGVPQPGFLPSNRSVAYKRSAWEQLGGLPEDLTLCADDLVMSLQLQESELNVRYAKDAVVHWNRHHLLSAFWREQHRYGFGMGEADVMRPAAGHAYALGGSKLAIYVEALRQAFLSYRAVAKAVLSGYIGAALFVPLLVFGNIVSINLGFAAGYKQGDLTCQACRRRLANLHSTA